MKPLLLPAAAILIASLAATAPAHPASCAPTVFPPYGTYARSGRLHGPGLFLAGGGGSEAPAAAFVWMHDRSVGPSHGRTGNVVVLRAYGEKSYDLPFYQHANFASVTTVLIPTCASRAQVDSVVPAVDKADALFFAGGDQSDYVAWKGSKLIEAVKRVYARGGVVGGGSAGLAIQGAAIYDSRAADRMNVETHTADAVKHPLEPRISFTTKLFAWPALARTITDTHFAVRDRFGRLVVFLARIVNDDLLGPGPVYGLGIDQASAVVVDAAGEATVLNAPGGRGAYLLRATDPMNLVAPGSIDYTVEVSHVKTNGERFDLLGKKTSDPWYAVTVNGSKTPPYSTNPY